MNKEKCKLNVLYSECKKFKVCKEENPGMFITCESYWEDTPDGKRIGHCRVFPTKEYHDHYYDRYKRSDGGNTGGHSDSI